MGGQSLYIHIGAHKTGTTFIQIFFDRNREWLQRHGFDYPQCCWLESAQHRLALALKGLRDPDTGAVPAFDAELADLKACIAEAAVPNILISSEEFFSLPREAIARLRDGLAEYDVHILAFVRRPDRLFESTYREKVQNPGHPFYGEIDDYLARPEDFARDLNMPEHIGNWADCFGQANIHLARFEDDGPVETVLSMLGLDASDVQIPAVGRYRSVSCQVIELMRLAKARKLDPGRLADVKWAAYEEFPPDEKSLLSIGNRRALLARFEAGLTDMFSKFDMENPYRKDMAREFFGPKYRRASDARIAAQLEEFLQRC